MYIDPKKHVDHLQIKNLKIPLFFSIMASLHTSISHPIMKKLRLNIDKSNKSTGWNRSF